MKGNPKQALARVLLECDGSLGVRLEWMRVLVDVFKADAALCHNVAFDPDTEGLCMCDTLCVGDSEYEAIATSIDGLHSADIEITVESIASFNTSTLYRIKDIPEPLYKRFWQPFGLTSALSYNAVEEGRFAGHLSLFRKNALSNDFDETDQQGRARAWEHATVQMLIVSRAMSLDTSTNNRGVFLYKPDGMLWMEGAGMGVWKDTPTYKSVCDAVRVFAASDHEEHTFFVEHTRIALTRLSTGDDVALLAVLQPMLSPHVSEFSKLTFTQRRVAAFAAAGATVNEVATTLCRSTDTVRSHLKTIYEELGIGSRAELSELYQTSLDWRPSNEAS